MVEPFASGFAEAIQRFAERNQLLNAVSWYDETAAKVIRKVEKFDRAELAALLEWLKKAKGKEAQDAFTILGALQDQIAPQEGVAPLRVVLLLGIGARLHRGGV